MADATAKSSGYLDSATSVAFNGTQTMASLTDNEYTDLSDEIDNSSNKYLLVDFELALGSFTPDGTDAGAELFVIPSVDGTNYPDWTGNTTTDKPENNQWYVGWFTIKDSDAAATPRAACRGVTVPPGKYKVGLRNRANATWASSGSTLKYRPHGLLSDEA